MPQVTLSPQIATAIADELLLRDALIQILRGTSIATVRAAVAARLSAAALAWFDSLANNFGA